MAARGSSLVEAVLACSGQPKDEGLGGRLARLSRRAEDLKEEVCSMINQRYVEFLPSMQSAEDLESQVEELSAGIDQLRSRIENEVQQDLNVAIADFADLKQQLEREVLVLSVLKQLQEARRSLKTMESRRGFELKILKALGRELTIQTQNILYLLDQEWQRMAATQTELHLCLPTEDPGVSTVLQAFAILGELEMKFKHFGQLLLKHVLKPLICCPSLRLSTEYSPDGVTLKFESVGSSLGHPSPLEVFAKLRSVFKVLHQHLLEEGEETDPRPVLAEVLGNVVWKKMSDCLICDCLVHSIPSNSSQLAQYKEVIKATEDFEKALKDMKFLPEDSTDLLTYARNVNCHFANKKCQDVIVAARNLMTSEIHNTVKSKLPEGPELLLKQVTNLENKTKLSRHTFSFPTCRISDSVQRLMALAYQTLQEASASTDQCCIQLFYLVRNIFHLFCDVVPMYHKENLQKLPQLAAIHHNNCMYIAHHLLTLGHQFRSQLSDGTATFIDLVPGFRKLGTKCFLTQMRVQKEELLERLSTSRNFSNLDDEDNYSAANRAVRQVLHQLKRLGKIWQDVLPVNIYCRAMGTLLNTALVEIISRVIALEDISAENADRLHALCKTVVDEGPRIFVPLPEEKENRHFQEEVPVYVPKWMMFQELMLVLQASLQEIVDRWAGSKGPLAAEFSPSEVKNLIRALFQNTERRAAALASIK
ncbi:hypothetical protein E2320_007226 [Naja naja]|nr:hypothetical protein E2320_007226 [Naja naja]